jgi:hypothetical protein
MPPRRPTAPAARDVDLVAGGFRLDVKTMLLLGGLLLAWYDTTQESKAQGEQNRAELAQLRTEVQEQEKARVAVAAAESEAQQVKQDALVKALEELEKQLKLTSLDIADLRVAVAQGSQATPNRRQQNNGG